MLASSHQFSMNLLFSFVVGLLLCVCDVSAADRVLGNEAGTPLMRNQNCSPNAKNEFVFKVNPYEGEWGQYEVENCSGVSPKLLIKKGVTYTLLQKDKSNWMHPLGLAYYPDGAHGFGPEPEVPELEEPTPDDCSTAKFACDPGAGVKEAPLYGINGVYESIDNWNEGKVSGLDVYEPLFQRPQDQWVEAGGDAGYGVKITIPANSKTKTFFYFCHIHAGMSGYMEVTDANESHNTLKLAGADDLGDTYYGTPSAAFDNKCGTFDVDPYHSKQDEFCSKQDFLCDRTGSDFSNCMQAINCKMNYMMRVKEVADNPLAVFMQQMIPHHENAVQMSRIAMKHATKAKGYDSEVEDLLRSIMATQNHQIQTMNTWLKTHASDGVVCSPPKISSALGVAGNGIGVGMCMVMANLV